MSEPRTRTSQYMAPAGREILMSFWKIHILHHAARRAVVGQWMMDELREHGYRISPGTLYPVLRRMETRGWLRSRRDADRGPRARREYTLTPEGRQVLTIVQRFLRELTAEVLDRGIRPVRRHR
jgi:PadR family transcriptional regulator, regulatory protein PadR